MYFRGRRSQNRYGVPRFTNPTLFYQWQNKLFEEGAVVFEQPRTKSNRQKAGVVLAVARRYTPGWPGRRIGQRWEPTRPPTQGPRPKAGRPVGRPSSLALRDWHQSDKSLGVQPRTLEQERNVNTGRRSPG